jgi:hypothetical protein
MLKKSKWLLIHLISSLSLVLSAQYQISGKIVDEKLQPLSYVSIYEAGTSNGTVSNEEGNYTLQLNAGKRSITYQQLGFITKVQTIDVNTDLILDIRLQEETFFIEEFIVSAGEDPAIGIMKNAIKAREKYKNKKEDYEAELYIKGLIKLTDAPEKVFGREIGNLDGTLDSNRQGILYLSESLSKVYVQSPDKYKEVMISSKVSGDDRGISVNQFSYANFNFYNEHIDLFRSIVSPLSDNAFSFYHFYLYEEIIDNNGQKVYKIKIKPKSEFRPCFTGFIYINDGLYNINAIDVYVKGIALKNPVFDTIAINQVFIPSNKKDDWRIFNQTILFQASIFAFKTKGAFTYVFKNYKDEPVLDKNFFDSEIFRVTNDAIKNDTTFWANNRPVPLTVEEGKDYVKKDSIARVIESPAYLDSVDRKNNKFKILDLIFGKTISYSQRKLYYGYTSPVNSLSFNPVEGTNISLRPFLRKENEDGYNIFSFRGNIKYGFVDKIFKYNIGGDWSYNIKSLGKLSFNAGSDYLQYNEQGIISVFGNTFQSLLYKNNVARLFKKNFAEIKWGSEIVNSLSFEFGVQHNERQSLINNTNFSWWRKDREYQFNNPSNEASNIFSINDYQLKYSLQLRWAPGQKYQSYPTYKSRIPSDYPTVYLQIENALPVNNTYSDYLKMKFILVDNYVGAKIFGHTRYRIEAGKFLINNKSTIIDAFHFRGNNLISGFKSPYMQTFKLQDGYEFSSEKDFVAFWYEHHFDGYIFDKIPLLKKSGLTEIVNFSTLIRDDIQYFEPGVGIEGFKLGAIDLMRIDYFWSFQNGDYKEQGFRIGFSTFFENILR